MVSIVRWCLIVWIVVLLAVLQPLSTVYADDLGEVLKTYVSHPDDSFAWQVRQRTRMSMSDCIELTLTSLTWKDIVWQHRLFLVVPDNVKDTADALLVIEGGRWKPSDAEPITDGKPAYPGEAALLAGFAERLGMPLAVVLNVPQQPVFNGKTEDEIIAYTFDQFLQTGQADWPLLLPMVKSVVKAMDAIQQFARQDRQLTINQFTLAGASKRGWTTWLTAAVDQRVISLAPMVIDMLNLAEQLPHQQASLGDLSARIHDYTDLDLPGRIDSPRGRQLLQIVDPWHYRRDLTQPKLLLLGTNDGYWTLDALNLYWDDLVGDKYVIYVPNADHDLSGDWVRVLGGIAALRGHAIGQQAMPQLRWQYQQVGSNTRLRIEPGEPVSQGLLWSASSPTRDFRQARWTSTPLSPNASGTFTYDMPAPEQGYTAVFAELTYPRGVLPLNLSTTIRVLGASD